MRKKFLNSGATKFLLGILIVAFVLSSISGILFMSNRYNILVIGDEKVNINTFVNIINNEKQTVYQRNPTEEQIKYLDSEEFLLETVNKVLITKLIGEEIKDYKFDEPEEIILSKIASEKSLFTNGKFDVKKFNDTLAAYNITENLYIKALQEQDSRNAFLSSFADVVDVNRNYAENLFNFSNKYADVTVFRINKSRLRVDDGGVRDDEIKYYYNSNIQKFMMPKWKKIDYLKLTNYSSNDVEKLEELVLLSENIEEVAKAMETKVQTLGYVSRSEIDGVKQNIFDLDLNDFSAVEKTGNDMFLYSVVDIRNEYTKTLEEAREEITDLIKEENREKQYDDLVSGYISNYEKSGFNSTILTTKGFRMENVRIYRNDGGGFDDNFVETILKTKDKNTTRLFMNAKEVYFAFIRSSGTANDKNENFVTKDTIKKNLNDSMVNSLQESYLSYLKATKYKVKINYKLLNLIR